MAEIKELKPKSFRIDEETAEKFKAISAELGNNQQQTLSKLIETYEFQKGKVVLTHKKEEMETFEKYASMLTRMYMTSLENNQNATELVRTEFEALLQSKDATIIELQERAKEESKKAASCKEATKQKEAELIEEKQLSKKLEKELAENERTFQVAMEDKEKVIQALTEACDGLKKDVNNLEVATLERSAIATKQMQLQQKYEALEGKYSALEAEYEKAKLLHERVLLQKEIECNKQLQSIEEKRTQEINEYQEKYLELLKQFQEKAKPLRVVKQTKK